MGDINVVEIIQKLAEPLLLSSWSWPGRTAGRFQGASRWQTRGAALTVASSVERCFSKLRNPEGPGSKPEELVWVQGSALRSSRVSLEAVES